MSTDMTTTTEERARARQLGRQIADEWRSSGQSGDESRIKFFADAYEGRPDPPDRTCTFVSFLFVLDDGE